MSSIRVLSCMCIRGVENEQTEQVCLFVPLHHRSSRLSPVTVKSLRFVLIGARCSTSLDNIFTQRVVKLICVLRSPSFFLMHDAQCIIIYTDGGNLVEPWSKWSAHTDFSSFPLLKPRGLICSVMLWCRYIQSCSLLNLLFAVWDSFAVLIQLGFENGRVYLGSSRDIFNSLKCNWIQVEFLSF